MAISTVVANSSKTAICTGFERIVENHIPNNRWLGRKNFYSKDTVKKVDSTNNIADVKADQLSEYIAASVVLHCYDGWNFISRAIESIISNDIPSAIHFLYYSELRAVMSFMGYQGIGIFNEKHFWFDVNSTCSFVEVQPNNFKIKTHGLANKCLEEWAKLSSRKEDLFDLVRVKNKRLSHWINATNSTTRSGYVSEIIKRWLKDWSMDLKLKPDQDLRNITSYRPHFDASYISTQQTINKLNIIWQAIEPTESSRFSIIDLHLSRIALERVFSKSTGKSPYTAKGKSLFVSFIDRTFDNIGEIKGESLYNFFLRNIEPEDHFLITEGKRNLNENNQQNLEDPFPMLCRAILLMRLSSGCVYELFENSTLDKKNLRYWWEDICNNIGISSAIDEELNPTDLYTDIKDAFGNILQRSNNGELNSLYAANTNFGSEFSIIKQFQRACFWGVGL